MPVVKPSIFVYCQNNYFSLNSLSILPAWLFPLFLWITTFTPSTLTFDNNLYMLRSVSPRILQAFTISIYSSITL